MRLLDPKSSGRGYRAGLPPTADIGPNFRNIRNVPILLQKSFWGVERKFLDPLVRFARGDVRDHIG